MRNLITFLFGISALFTLALFNSQMSFAQAQLVCPTRGIIQITDEPIGGSGGTSINADGRFVAFQSSANINGGNPDLQNEIYLFDSRTQTITQITNFEGQESVDPSINADGTRIAFSTDANINGGNPNNRRQIYIFDTRAGIFIQVTNDPGILSFSGNPSINADGTRVAFASESNINGGNPNNFRQIYVFDTTTGIFTPVVSNPTEDSNDPSIDAQGRRVAFDSRDNINGGNPNNNTEVYLFDSTTGNITQITNFDNSMSSVDASISADGTLVAFESNQNINGTNPGGIEQIFIFDSLSGDIRQITSGMGDSADPSISGTGTRVAFETESNINGENPGSNDNVFIFDTTTNLFTRVAGTLPPSETSDPSTNFDGTRIAFESNGDLLGPNIGDNFQVYLARCLDPSVGRPIPTLSQWGLITMVGLIGIAGLIFYRRRTRTV